MGVLWRLIAELAGQGNFRGQDGTGPFPRQDPLPEIFQNAFPFFAFFHSAVPLFAAALSFVYIREFTSSKIRFQADISTEIFIIPIF